MHAGTIVAPRFSAFYGDGGLAVLQTMNQPHSFRKHWPPYGVDGKRQLNVFKSHPDRLWFWHERVLNASKFIALNMPESRSASVRSCNKTSYKTISMAGNKKKNTDMRESSKISWGRKIVKEIVSERRTWQTLKMVEHTLTHGNSVSTCPWSTW